MPKYIYTDHVYFFTSSIIKRQQILKSSEFKNVITDSLHFLHTDRRMTIYAFVIMMDHIHIIWQANPEREYSDVQRDFLKFTAQSFKFKLLANENFKTLSIFEVNASDRKYQFWKRKPLSIPLYSPKVFDQKLAYIHDNPVKAGYCLQPEEYYHSSARFYEYGQDDFGFLSHHAG